jgi:hypothetical protein
MNKPYIKKYSEVSGITVWIVDGFHIRQNMDINFSNFGQHYRFNYIPKEEFWLDRQANPGEEPYFIEHLLAENKMMAEGKDYNDALDEGDKAEQDMRDQDPRIMGLKRKLQEDKPSVLKEIRLELLKKYSNEVVKTCVVDSSLIRSLFYIDWVAGGHDKVYPAFVPPNEVWIDNDIVAEERKFVLLHELHERYYMSQGYEYNHAHASALEEEAYCHKNPEELEAKIQYELARQV